MNSSSSIAEFRVQFRDGLRELIRALATLAEAHANEHRIESALAAISPTWRLESRPSEAMRLLRAELDVCNRQLSKAKDECTALFSREAAGLLASGAALCVKLLQPTHDQRMHRIAAALRPFMIDDAAALKLAAETDDGKKEQRFWRHFCSYTSHTAAMARSIPEVARMISKIEAVLVEAEKTEPDFSALARLGPCMHEHTAQVTGV